MNWTADTAVALYRPRPQDAPANVFKARLSVCESCPVRRLNRCRAENQIATVMARPAKGRCPRSKWPGEKPKRTSIRAGTATVALRCVPTAKPTTINRLAVVTCYFNPMGYRRIRENYDRFARGMREAGAELWTIELAFDDDPFQLSPAGCDWRLETVRGTRERNLLWQKERLLNLLITRLPADVDAVAWIDADILFLNPNWLEATRAALGRYAVVQPWVEAHSLKPDGTLETLRKSTAWYWHHEPGKHTDFTVSHPGFAWAARADWLRLWGLNQEMVTGGGDSLMVRGFTGAELHIEGWLCPSWRDSVLNWASAVHVEVAGAFGYVPGSILHLYHGSRENRRYRERWEYLTDRAFDPVRDLRIDDTNGVLAWSDFALQQKPQMVNLVRGYFAERREDD